MQNQRPTRLRRAPTKPQRNRRDKPTIAAPVIEGPAIEGPGIVDLEIAALEIAVLAIAVPQAVDRGNVRAVLAIAVPAIAGPVSAAGAIKAGRAAVLLAWMAAAPEV
jgi:hypothetical protein